MFKKLYMPFLFSFTLLGVVYSVPAEIDEADLHFMSKQELIKLAKDRRQSQQSAIIWATLKGIGFGSAATYATLWWFNANPQTAHKTFLKAISPF